MTFISGLLFRSQECQRCCCGHRLTLIPAPTEINTLYSIYLTFLSNRNSYHTTRGKALWPKSWTLLYFQVSQKVQVQDTFCSRILSGGFMSLLVGPFLDSENIFSPTSISFDFSVLSISVNDGGFLTTFHRHCPRLPESPYACRHHWSLLPSQPGRLSFQSMPCPEVSAASLHAHPASQNSRVLHLRRWLPSSSSETGRFTTTAKFKSSWLHLNIQ